MASRKSVGRLARDTEERASLRLGPAKALQKHSIGDIFHVRLSPFTAAGERTEMVQLAGAYLHLTAGCMWHRIFPDEPSSIDGQRITARNKRR